MSKKHFHSIGTGRKMFQYTRQEVAGLPRRLPPKKKPVSSEGKANGHHEVEENR